MSSTCKTSFSIYNDEAEANKENIGGITKTRDVKGKGEAAGDDVGVCSKGNQASMKASSACVTKPSYSRRALQTARTDYSDAANDCDSLDAQRNDLWNGRKPFEPASPQSTTQTKAAGRAETIYDLPTVTSAGCLQTSRPQPAALHVSKPNKAHADLKLAQRFQQQDVDRRVRELTESPLADVTQAYIARGAFCNSPLSQHKVWGRSTCWAPADLRCFQSQTMTSVRTLVSSAVDKLTPVQSSVDHTAMTPGDLANTVSTLHLQSCRPAYVSYNGRVNKPVKRVAAMRA